MGLVKRILCKVRHVVIDPVGRLCGDPVGDTALNALLRVSVYKVLPLLCHNGGLLL